MIEGQIRPSEVTDSAVIAAFEAIPREEFVPPSLKGVAYLDEDIEVSPGRYLLAPMILARLVQALAITAGDNVLDIGGASGYSAAIVSKLGASVTALEEDKKLADRAAALLKSLGADNVTVVCGSPAAGHKAKTPYNAILINGMFDDLPVELEHQMAEGGRLAGVKNLGGVGKAVLYVKAGGVTGCRELFDAAVPPLPGFQKAAGFQF
jgi:protein-L-isoaspartate(D-aspartate) O-methyltransferase